MPPRRQGIFWILTIPTMDSRPISPCPANGSKANLNTLTRASCTGKLSWRSARKLLFQESPTPLAPTMPNSPEAQPLETMYGKKTPELLERSSSSASSRSTEQSQTTGRRYGKTLNMDCSNKFPHKSVYRVTGLSEPSALTMRDHLVWSDLAQFTGVQLALEIKDCLGAVRNGRLP